MKHIHEFIAEARWQSQAGTFNEYHLKEITKMSKLSEKQVMDALNAFDDEFGGPVEWEIGPDGKTLIFNQPDAGRSFEYRNGKWSKK